MHPTLSTNLNTSNEYRSGATVEINYEEGRRGQHPTLLYGNGPDYVGANMLCELEGEGSEAERNETA
jgi:hypothetical protein